MLLQHKQDLLAIFPQSKWDKIDTIVPKFLNTERTKLRTYLGQPLLDRLNEDYQDYALEGIQAALVSSAFSDATDAVSSDSPLVLELISACQHYIANLTFANNIRIFASSFNRGGGVNRAYSDSYETLEEKDYAALSKELFMQAQDALEQIFLILEQDAASTTPLYTSLWKQNARYFYHHASLLFPTATALNPYYDIKERRETYQSLVPTIESCQRRYLLPNLGKSLYNAFLTLANSVFGSSPSEESTTTTSTEDTTQAQPDSTLYMVNGTLNSALPDLLHSLAYYLRADLATNDKYNQPSQSYLLKAEQHRNLAMRIICEEPTLMKDYICGTPLDLVYADLNNGTTLTDQLAKEAAIAAGNEAPCTQKHSHNLPKDSFILDLT